MTQIPEKMRAAYIKETGGTDKIQIGELPLPTPAADEVLVKVEASEANFVDLFVRSGAFPTDLPMPFVIGRDVVGTVVESGRGLSGFKAGEKVWCNSMGHDGRQGTWAQYVAVPKKRLYPLPDGVHAADSAAVLHAAGTAYIGLFREAHIQSGETILVEGAAGAVGTAVMQMAKKQGAKVIATASDKDFPWCKQNGAEAVFDYHDDDRYEAIHKLAPNGVNIWWDTSGHNNFSAVLPLIAMHGRVVVMSGLQGSEPELPVGALYTKEITLHGFAISNATAQDLAQAAKVINPMLAAGELKARIGTTFDLEDAAFAQDTLATGQVKGRIVVLP